MVVGRLGKRKSIEKHLPEKAGVSIFNASRLGWLAGCVRGVGLERAAGTGEKSSHRRVRVVRGKG